MKQNLKNRIFKKNSNTYIWVQKKETQKLKKHENIIHIYYPVYIYCN